MALRKQFRVSGMTSDCSGWNLPTGLRLFFFIRTSTTTPSRSTAAALVTVALKVRSPTALKGNHLTVSGNLQWLDAEFTESTIPDQVGKEPAFAPEWVLKA